MTAEIVNLNKVRKARERANREREAHENRLKYGQSKAERTVIQSEHLKSEAGLDGAKRDDDGSAERADDIDPSTVS
jgi:benzoyl-CoA reductase/2-hydroxyglutaryl-CoA dehydratase subunit BcrC/BadD/HgdB